jgi:hypothetical protein
MTGPTPKLLAMVVCDDVIQDRRSNKISLIGIFDRFLTPSLPAIIRPIGVYARLVDAQGEYTFRLDLVRVRDLKTIGSATAPAVHIEDRLHSFELVFSIPPLKFEESGPYEFRLFADELHVGNGPFQVVQIQPEGS